MAYLSNLARLIRSKNAGPFNQTLDILFEDEANYLRVKDSGMINSSVISSLYGVLEENVLIFFCDVALAIKIAFPRKVSAGDIGNTDVFGAQQHAPLLNIEIK